MIYQRTIADSVSITGIGIHSGKKVTLTLHPSDSDTGIRFRRVDLPEQPILKADAINVGATENATTIGKGREAIHTIEHLISALYGFGIDNVLCDLDGPEIPIMDGSSGPFTFVLKEIGITHLSKVKSIMVIKKPVRVDYGEKWATIEPHPSLCIESTIVFSHAVISKQCFSFEFNFENYMKQISRARTFGFLKDADMLKRKGLARGGSLNNAIIIDDNGVMNPDGLRFRDEFIRHKILDTIGDVSLLGHQIAGKITTYKSGHHVHNLLCRKVLEDPSNYEIISAQVAEAEQEEYAPSLSLAATL